MALRPSIRRLRSLDAIVAFKYQSQFVDGLKAAGHAAKLIEVEGEGAQHHGVEQFSLPVAGACLNGVTDESIVWAVAREQSAGRQQQALAQLGWQYRKLKPAAAGTKPSDPRTLAGVVRPSAVAANDERDCANRKAGGQIARIAACTNILKSNPSSFHALANRAVAYDVIGEYRKALADLNEAFQHVHIGALAGLYLERGTAHEGLGNHKLAIADFNEAIGWDPSLVVAYFGRATAYEAIGRGELAGSDLDKAIQLDRNLVAALSMQRGYALHSARHYDEAIVAFNRAIDLRPDWPLAYFGRAASYQEKGNSKLAVADYRKCLEFNATTELVRQRQQLAREQLEKFNEG